jgi:hypothetical protein
VKTLADFGPVLNPFWVELKELAKGVFLIKIGFSFK